MTQLRQQMIRAIELKNLSKNTQRAYLAAVTGLAKHDPKSPAQITDKMIENYLLYLKKDKGNAPNSCGSVLTGLRFFYKNVATIPIWKYRTLASANRLRTSLFYQ
jgi:integrase/recombinase XerD